MIRLKTPSYRFAEQVLNSQFGIKQEIGSIRLDPGIDLKELTRPFLSLYKIDNDNYLLTCIGELCVCTSLTPEGVKVRHDYCLALTAK
jgi:hypothetical protein